MGQRTAPRGTPNTWEEGGGQQGPAGSNLFATFYSRGKLRCADIEELVGRSKRRLHRIEGEHAHAQAVAWMDGFVAGLEHSKKPPIVQAPRVGIKRPKRDL